jgi:hypothetical protein
MSLLKLLLIDICSVQVTAMHVPAQLIAEWLLEYVGMSVCLCAYTAGAVGF